MSDERGKLHSKSCRDIHHYMRSKKQRASKSDSVWREKSDYFLNGSLIATKECSGLFRGPFLQHLKGQSDCIVIIHSIHSSVLMVWDSPVAESVTGHVLQSQQSNGRQKSSDYESDWMRRSTYILKNILSPPAEKIKINLANTECLQCSEGVGWGSLLKAVGISLCSVLWEEKS